MTSPSVEADDQHVVTFANTKPDTARVGHGKEDPDVTPFWGSAGLRMIEVGRDKIVEERKDVVLRKIELGPCGFPGVVGSEDAVGGEGGVEALEESCGGMKPGHPESLYTVSGIAQAGSGRRRTERARSG